MSFLVSIAVTSKGQIEFTSFSSDCVLFRVLDEHGAVQAKSTTCGYALTDLCFGVISALQTDSVCFARTPEGSVQLRVLNGSFVADVGSVCLQTAISELLSSLETAA